MKEGSSRPKTILERNLLGEEESKYLSRDEKGRFVGKKTQRKEDKKVEVDNKPRDIKLVKVKGTYGTFLVVEKKSFRKVINQENVSSLILVFIFVPLITKVLMGQMMI